LTPAVRASARKLGDFMAKHQVADLSRIVACSRWPGSGPMAELAAFLELLTGRGLGMPRAEAHALAAAFTVDKPAAY